MGYWEECIFGALAKVEITATEEQIFEIAEWVEAFHENFGMAHGHDCIPKAWPKKQRLELSGALKNKRHTTL